MIENLVTFTWEERNRLDTEHNNMLGGAFGEVVRYRRFLEVIVARCDEAGAGLLALNQEFQSTLQPGGPHVMDDRQVRLSNEKEYQTMVWQPESAYLFAKILLDKVAQGLEFYFGQVHRCSLDSHDDLVKCIEAYRTAKNIVLPAGFLRSAQQLKQDVSDFRDYQIAHHKSPRTVRGFAYDQTGAARLLMTQLYPREADQQRESRPTRELLADIDAYLVQFMELVRSNRNLTSLRQATE